jgi:acetyltransferase-like isoleucine patch superfamily enzyme
VLIAAHTSINTVSHHFERCDIPINDQGIYCDPVRIEDDAWIGMNAVILQGVTIGKGAVVGAGAVVTRDVPAWSIVMGVPARIVSQRDNAPVAEDVVHA